MAHKFPRVKCPGCGRDVAGIPTKRIGVLSLVDHKREKRALVLCPWSESQIPAPDARFVQEELQEAVVPVIPAQRVEKLPLF